jgi:hypothetical protein
VIGDDDDLCQCGHIRLDHVRRLRLPDAEYARCTVRTLPAGGGEPLRCYCQSFEPTDGEPAR